MADYYIENGYMVFTAEYLKKRNKCCGSGCRHCPYSSDYREYSCHKKVTKPILQGESDVKEVSSVQ
jgi:hypothetical protein